MHQPRWQLLCFVLSVYVVASAAFAAAFYLLCLAAPETLEGAKPKGMALIEVRTRAQFHDMMVICVADLPCLEGGTFGACTHLACGRKEMALIEA